MTVGKKRPRAFSIARALTPPDQALMPWFKASFGYTLFLLLLLSPLFLQRVEPLWDARDMGYPGFNYVADSVKESRFPLWDPYTNCGYPFHADPNNPTLSVVAVVLGYLVPDSSVGFDIYWAFHWWLGGIGMLWLARHFGAKPLGGLAAAVAFSLSGFFVSHAEHTSFIVVAGWLPWVFLFADKAVLDANHGWSLLGGFALGMSCLGGYPGLIMFNGFAIAFWLGLRFLTWREADGGPSRSLRERVLTIAATLTIIGMVSLVAWSPVLHAFFTEGASYSDRVGIMDPETANYNNVFTLPAVFSLLFPYATIAGQAHMQSDISMTNGYAGILTFPLAALWWWNERKRRRHWWIIIFILFMFLLSFGGQAGLRKVMYYLYPPLQQTRHSATFRLYWILPVTLMSGMGISSIRTYIQENRTVRTVFVGWLVITLLVAGFLVFFLSSHGVEIARHTPRLFFPALVILPLAVIILWSGTRVYGSVHRPWVLPAILLVLVAVDMAGHLINNSLTVWSPSSSTRQVETLRKYTTTVDGEPGPRHPPKPFGSYNAQQVIKQPVVEGYVALNSGGFDGVLCKSRFVEVLQSSRRFWLSPGTEPYTDMDAALSILASLGAGDPLPAFVEQESVKLPHARTIPGAFGMARIMTYAPEHIVMEVDVPPGDGGFLASTERFAAGWKGWLDDQPQQVVRTNLFFRGMQVPPGRHRIVWKYDPSLWMPLTVASYGTLISAVGMGTVLLYRRRKKG